MDVDRHYIGSVTATTQQEKGIITLESNPSRGTVLPAPHGKGNTCDKNVKYKRTDALSLWHQRAFTDPCKPKVRPGAREESVLLLG